MSISVDIYRTLQAVTVENTFFASAHNTFSKTDQILGHKISLRGFPGGAVVENLPANAGDMGSSPGLGGSHVPRSN